MEAGSLNINFFQKNAIVSSDLPTSKEEHKVMQVANDYYFFTPKPKSDVLPDEYKDIDTLAAMIQAEDCEALENSPLLKKYGVNYPFGYLQETLLHVAYSKNKPKVVKWLRAQGASEKVCTFNAKPPMLYAVSRPRYYDTEPRVINAIIEKFLQASEGKKDPHVLFDVMQAFISEHKWKYCDSNDREKKPFRDGAMLCQLGAPELIYHVNCVDLANLFVHIAHKMGIDAELYYYVPYSSVSTKTDKIMGDFALFDGSKRAPFEFDTHIVVLSMNYYFDLTLSCKYENAESVLLK